MKLVVGISGASGVELGIKLIAKIIHLESLQIYAVFSESAKRVLLSENHFDIDTFLSTIKLRILDSTQKNNCLKNTTKLQDSAKLGISHRQESAQNFIKDNIVSFQDSTKINNSNFTKADSTNLDNLDSATKPQIPQVAAKNADKKSIAESLADSTIPRTLESSLQVISHHADKICIFDDSDLSAAISSGSFGVDSMLILPCSMNTLAKIACGISDTLITRSALVCLKERRNLVLSPREMPFSTIALEQMTKLSTLGVTIAPPILGYYAKSESLEDMENFVFGKLLDSLRIKHNLFKRWGDE